MNMHAKVSLPTGEGVVLNDPDAELRRALKEHMAVLNKQADARDKLAALTKTAKTSWERVERASLVAAAVYE